MAEGEIAAGRLEVVKTLGFSAPALVCHCSYKKGNALAETLLAGAAQT